MPSIHNLSHAERTGDGDKPLPPAGPPLHMVANPASGTGEGADLVGRARAACILAGRPLVLHDTAGPGGLAGAARRAHAGARADGGVVVAAGGDGTVRSVAQELVGGAVPLAVVPVGTFNFFARNHGIPEDTDAALALALDGLPREVALGEVNEQVFLVNASFGLYARAVAQRERDTARFGRNRAVVIASTVLSLLRGHPLMDLELEAGGSAQRVRTPMVFVGSNALQLRDVERNVAHCLRDGRLAVVVLRPVGFWGMLRLALSGLARALQQEEKLQSFCADRLRVHPRRRRIRVALDGELFNLRTPLCFSTRPAAIRVLLPGEPMAGAAAAARGPA